MDLNPNRHRPVARWSTANMFKKAEARQNKQEPLEIALDVRLLKLIEPVAERLSTSLDHRTFHLI